MATIAYMKLVQKGEGPLLGSSTTPGWLQWSEVWQAKFEVEQPVDAKTERVRQPRPAVDVTKETDGVSQRLRQNLTKNIPFDSMTIDFVRTLADGKTLQKYARLECTEVYVASLATARPVSADRSSDLRADSERVQFRCRTMSFTKTGAPPTVDSWQL